MEIRQGGSHRYRAAAAATAGSLAANTALWASGNGSWKAVLFDAISLATFGLGKLFMRTAKSGFGATKTALENQAAKASLRGASLKGAPGRQSGADNISDADRKTMAVIQGRANAAQARAETARATATAAADVLPEVSRLARLLPGGLQAAQIRTLARQWADECPDVAAVARATSVTLTNLRLATATGMVGDGAAIVGGFVKPHSSTTEAGMAKVIVSRLSKMVTP